MLKVKWIKVTFLGKPINGWGTIFTKGFPWIKWIHSTNGEAPIIVND